MYENPEQIDPIYDAKGIETVRRDGCPAVCKVICFPCVSKNIFCFELI